VIRRTNAGTIISPDDVKAIEEEIWSLYLKWQKGELKTALDWEEIRKYDAKVTTRILADVLTQISQKKLSARA
jgi:hypothetical protein